jgi:hypothetical protein
MPIVMPSRPAQLACELLESANRNPASQRLGNARIQSAKTVRISERDALAERQRHW